MADVRFFAFTVNDEKLEIKGVKSFELSRESDAPCDGLRLWFTCDKALDEIYRLEMEINGRLVFNGCCDTQRETLGASGYNCFVYARSSACVLTDSEAKPDSFFSPSARAIFEKYVKDSGFSYDMPETVYSGQYMIAKGTSLFGALDGFVFAVTGKHIYVTPFNEIKLLESERTVCLNSKIISEKRVINRGDLLCGVDYKLSSEENYAHHRVSELMKRKKVAARVMKNLSSLTPIQREQLLSSIMAQANDEYVSYEVDVCGLFSAELCDRIEYSSLAFDDLGELKLSGITYLYDSNGFHTRLKLIKIADLEELSYVDE